MSAEGVRDGDPPLEIFTRAHGGGWAQEFVLSLNGAPLKLPPDHQTPSGQTALGAAARALGKTVVTRKWKGEYWAFLLAEESGV